MIAVRITEKSATVYLAPASLPEVWKACDDNNICSALVIERNGGVLEDKITNQDEYGEMLTRRYWIAIR